MAKVQTGVIANGLSGKAGSAVLVQTRNGVIVRPHVEPHNPRTPAQTQVRGGMARAVAAYKALTPGQANQWRTWAQTQWRIERHSRAAYRPTGYAAFIALASKWAQLNPTGATPTSPPAFPYDGDARTLTAAGQAGQIVWTASGPNDPNTRTELLVQRLKGAANAPITEFYRSKAFVGFTSGSLSAGVALSPGFYAPAFRFVNSQTGQTTIFVALPVVQVG